MWEDTPRASVPGGRSTGPWEDGQCAGGGWSEERKGEEPHGVWARSGREEAGYSTKSMPVAWRGFSCARVRGREGWKPCTGAFWAVPPFMRAG